ncbi:hypothetical protein ACFW16_20765 [Inquilinus sp. NPDC058860]|uniref:hypothetical protein n=1 Tax=Inquilinus sp. NPDC058860 TaxID=3346652 RepID=UPI0036A89CA4
MSRLGPAAAPTRISGTKAPKGCLAAAQSVFAQHGGFAAIDRDFDQHLESVLQDLNDAIWGRPAA